MIERVALLVGFVVGLALPSSAVAIADPWVLWSRDTQFRDRQSPRHWRTDPWALRGGPFGTREQCQRLMDDHLHSAARLLGDGYRVTSVVGSSLVARQVEGSGGLRRRYMCLPVSVAPPK